jgi:dihydrolipoyl dehydrogenase
VSVLTSAKAKRLSSDKNALVVETADGNETTLLADKILVTVGREPATESWGLDLLDLDRNGLFIKIDDHCRTSMRGIYAIGDVTGEPMLAHRAAAQRELVAEIVAGRKRAWDKIAIPSICFTDPQVISAGLSLAEAKAAGIDVVTDVFPFRANGRALTLGREDGFVRVIARRDNHVLLGVQGVGAAIAELSAAFAPRSRCARDWKMSPRLSTRIRRRARLSTKPP